MVCSIKHTIGKWTYAVITDLAHLGKESEIKEGEESGSIRTIQAIGNIHSMVVNWIRISKNISDSE